MVIGYPGDNLASCLSGPRLGPNSIHNSRGPQMSLHP